MHRSLSARRAWIEICCCWCRCWSHGSLSARRAWIEIGSGTPLPQPGRVALRKESVDRNRHDRAYRVELDVALRKESVDRNDCLLGRVADGHESLSARRAWIEIPGHPDPDQGAAVALRKESVDRNWFCLGTRVSTTLSLSARRAWIEIGKQHNAHRDFAVALRKESVDRNTSL